MRAPFPYGTTVVLATICGRNRKNPVNGPNLYNFQVQLENCTELVSEHVNTTRQSVEGTLLKR